MPSGPLQIELEVSIDEAAEQLSKALPKMVDHMTPDGVLPSADAAKSAATSG